MPNHYVHMDKEKSITGTIKGKLMEEKLPWMADVQRTSTNTRE